MSNNKQSSVEWAIDKITMICAFYNNKEMSKETFEWYHNDIVTKAKAMHKEEVKTAHIEGFNTPSDYFNAEHYYNETFGDKQ